MAESIEDFLGITKKKNMVAVSGSLACQECEEIVNDGFIDEDEMIMYYSCSQRHESRIRM